ncbi:phage head spike fiber domain-containing protein [Trabulsiella odontotermitis]|uniref:phage head spike fiber domain-containing protein n=1 Tax=Trabulsiella odontotermitis TaxID=379893 RepID=UPI003ACFF747
MSAPHIPVIGFTSAALWVPGAKILGDRDGDGEPAPDIINMTLAALDPRLTYTGPAHYYFNSAGVLTLSAENEWPVEYRNGVPMGRHDPEPSATNILTSSRQFSALATTGLFNAVVTDAAGTGIDGTATSAMSMTVTPDTRGGYVRVSGGKALAGEWFSFSVFYKKSDPVVIRTDIYDAAICLMNASNFSFTETIAAGKTGHVDVESWGDWCRVTCSNLFLADTTASLPAYCDMVRFLGSSQAGSPFTTLVDMMQIEKTELSTSPVTTTGAAATRTESSLTMDTTGVSYIVVGYSNGSSVNYDTPDDTFTFPTATENWGVRYISAIEVIPE